MDKPKFKIGDVVMCTDNDYTNVCGVVEEVQTFPNLRIVYYRIKSDVFTDWDEGGQYGQMREHEMRLATEMERTLYGEV